MGLAFIDKNADFSAFSLGHLGLYTSVTSGLLGLFETRRSIPKTVQNSAPGVAGATILGAPTLSAGSANVSNGNGVVFPSAPNASHTIAVVAKMKAGGSITGDMVVGSWSAASFSAKGAAYLNIAGYQARFESTVYTAGATPPLSTATTAAAILTLPSVASFELLVGQVENGVSIRLYHPKSGAVATTSATGKDFANNAALNYQTISNPAGAAQDVALFAHWNRVLTPTEIATFYAEIQPQLARISVLI